MKTKILFTLLTLASSLSSSPSLAGTDQECARAPHSSYCHVFAQATTAGVSNEAKESAQARLQREQNEVGTATFTASHYKPGLIRHIVLFRYRSNVTPEEKSQSMSRFLALKNIARRDGKPYIVSIETGAQMSGEGADQNLEQGFVVTFQSEGDRNFYVGAPVVNNAQFYDVAHQAYKDFVGPLLEQNGALVFDFHVTLAQ